ncbi:MAG: hypothetical protein ABSE59_11720 [Opitutaceae bacterium]|jgi:hypothetical protein
MKPKSFKHLLKAVKQMKAIQRGEIAPARVAQVTSDGTGGYVHRKIDPDVWRRRQVAPHAKSRSESGRVSQLITLQNHD